MEYTVKQLATLAGVSVRTLHYYDEIGLLPPARVTQAGYRLYGPAQVDALQSILFYRALGMPLAQIRPLAALRGEARVAALRALSQVERELGLRLGGESTIKKASGESAGKIVEGRPGGSVGESIGNCEGSVRALPKVAGILDGPSDYITKALNTFDAPDVPIPADITTKVKGDQHCATVATAAVIAKVTRDRLMVDLAQSNPRYAAYEWAHNKGYGSAAHRTAIAEHGPTPLHRVSWHLT